MLTLWKNSKCATTTLLGIKPLHAKGFWVWRGSDEEGSFWTFCAFWNVSLVMTEQMSWRCELIPRNQSIESKEGVWDQWGWGMTILDLSTSSAGRLFKTQGDAPFHSHWPVTDMLNILANWKSKHANISGTGEITPPDPWIKQEVAKMRRAKAS